jgi:hypothetical protein
MPAIIANERNAEQRLIPMLERQGVVVVRLLDQVAAGRDDRQLIFLPPGSSPNLVRPVYTASSLKSCCD